MITEAQRAERRTGLGGSDAAAVLGISPWKRPIDIYLEKKHGTITDTRGETDAMWFGTEEEAIIAKRFSMLTGLKMVNYNFTLRDGPLMAHVDRLIVEPGLKIAAFQREIRTSIFAEIKTSGKEWESAEPVGEINGCTILDGDAGVPPYYQSQINHYFGRMPMTRICFVPVKMSVPVRSASGAMFARTDFRIYRLLRDDAVVKAQDEYLRGWWQAFIVGDKVPAAESEEDAKHLWTVSRPKTSVAVTAPLLDAYKRLAKAKATIEAATAEESKATAEIKIALKDKEALIGMDGSTILATWKSGQERRTSRTDWEKLARSKGVTEAEIASATTVDTVPATRTFKLRTSEDVAAYVKAVDTIEDRNRREAEAARRQQEQKAVEDIFAA